MTQTVFAVPNYCVISSLHGTINQCADFTPHEIDDEDFYVSIVRQAKANRGFGVEGIGEILR